MKRHIKAALLIGGSTGLGAAAVFAGRRAGRLRLGRGLAALQLVARGGARYAGSAPRLFLAAGEQRQQLRNDLALQTAEDVAVTLGAMKGVLVKLGQMASYMDDGLAPAARRTARTSSPGQGIWSSQLRPGCAGHRWRTGVPRRSAGPPGRPRCTRSSPCRQPGPG